MPKGLGICLEIMVSPVRIRVPPLIKVLQNAEKRNYPGETSGGIGSNETTVYNFTLLTLICSMNEGR
jgi:hypothetical protein